MIVSCKWNCRHCFFFQIHWKHHLVLRRSFPLPWRLRSRQVCRQNETTAWHDRWGKVCSLSDAIRLCQRPKQEISQEIICPDQSLHRHESSLPRRLRLLEDYRLCPICHRQGKIWTGKDSVDFILDTPCKGFFDSLHKNFPFTKFLSDLLKYWQPSLWSLTMFVCAGTK